MEICRRFAGDPGCTGISEAEMRAVKFKSLFQVPRLFQIRKLGRKGKKREHLAGVSDMNGNFFGRNEGIKRKPFRSSPF